MYRTTVEKRVRKVIARAVGLDPDKKGLNSVPLSANLKDVLKIALDPDDYAEIGVVWMDVEEGLEAEFGVDIVADDLPRNILEHRVYEVVLMMHYILHIPQPWTTPFSPPVVVKNPQHAS